MADGRREVILESALNADSGLRRARVLYKTMVNIGASSLDCLAVQNEERTKTVYACAMPLYESVPGEFVRLDKEQIDALGVPVGKQVYVIKVVPKKAREIWISGDPGLEKLGGYIDTKTFVTFGDNFVRHSGSSNYGFIIEKYIPRGRVVEVTKKTVFHVNGT